MILRTAVATGGVCSAPGEEGLQGAQRGVFGHRGEVVQRAVAVAQEAGDESVGGEVSEELGLVRFLAQAASSIAMTRSVGAS